MINNLKTSCNCSSDINRNMASSPIQIFKFRLWRYYSPTPNPPTEEGLLNRWLPRKQKKCTPQSATTGTGMCFLVTWSVESKVITWYHSLPHWKKKIGWKNHSANTGWRNSSPCPKHDYAKLIANYWAYSYRPASSTDGAICWKRL